jgi:hypothetical protein
MVTKRGQSQTFKLDVRNVDQLQLVVRCAGKNDYAHAVWVEPVLRE